MRHKRAALDKDGRLSPVDGAGPNPGGPKFLQGNDRFGRGNVNEKQYRSNDERPVFDRNKNQPVLKMQKGPKRTHQLKIADTEECGEDVRKFCVKKVWDKNFMVLDCLQNDVKMDEELSRKCHHFLWSYKMNLTKDDRFEHASQEMCKVELQQIKECSSLPQGSGLIIPCLIEYFDNITSKVCRQFLNKMATIVFSDYTLIYKFTDACSSDIQRLSCGRMDGNEEEIHSQGGTLACLAEHMTDLQSSCKLQVLRTYELQSDDFHLDRPLYYACRDDRERFCEKVIAGGGKVFECLYKHITEKTLSGECRTKLELRQKLMSEDVKIEKTFYKACKRDIEQNDCFSGSTNHQDAKRASVLLCLENAAKTGKKIKGKCLAEMEDVRRMIMEDYKATPDLVAACGSEIESSCSDRDIGGDTIHCLMGLAQHGDPKSPISARCKAQVSKLLQEADVASDIRLDKSLQRACQTVIDRVCQDIPKGEGGVMNCLMENIDSDEMTDKCEERLLEIQFFVMRDFRLDIHLYKSCRTDAKKLCHAGDEWADPNSMTPDQGPLVLSCLHDHAKDRDQVSRACKQEIKRVMKTRALSVKLNPDIEKACLKNLGEFCSDDRVDNTVGAEMDCLQENYEDLDDECKRVIGDLVEEEDEDIELDHILMKACTPMIKKFCGDLLDSEPDDVLECLIEHKNSNTMDSKCAAGVEHHQLITQKEFRFNHKFKEACQDAVQKYCLGKKKKAEIVVCLSEHIRNDTLLDKEPRINKPCRQQVRQQILHRSENINLDPELKDKCGNDISKFCSNVTPGNAAITECLKKKQRKLEDPCHRLLFKREKDEFSIGDYGLLSACKKMITTHCNPDDDQPQILQCLKKNKDLPDFDAKCRSVILRREVMQSKDYRLNPSLQKSCHLDIGKFCSSVVEQYKRDAASLEGKVISCLKKQYAVKRLSRACEMEISEVIKDAAGDIREAPVLEKACMKEIHKHCEEFIVKSSDSDNEMDIHEAGKGRVEECLKEKFRQKLLTDIGCRKEISYLIQEEEVDVNVDPLLKAGCQKELIRLCRGVRPGEGRLMSCLLSVLEEDPKSLSTKCKSLLEKRKEMWEYAAQVAPIEGFQELYTQISESPAKFYILGVLLSVVCLIFFFGIGCGRVTKRIRTELKNK